MNGAVVVDASLAIKWLVDEINSDLALSLTRAWLRQGTRVVAPYLMPIEVSNALFQKARQGQLTVTDAAGLVENLVSERIDLLEPPGFHSKAVELAGLLQQNAVYDAHYLALAESLDCDLWTADKRFHQAAVNDFPRVHLVG